MNKDQWSLFEKELCRAHGHVDLIVDGFDVALIVQQYKMKLAIMTYVNKYFRGEWLSKDCPERKFMRPVMRSAHTRKMLKIIKDARKKRAFKNATWLPDEKKTFTYYTTTWNSTGSLRRHLTKNFTSIELADGEEARLSRIYKHET